MKTLALALFAYTAFAQRPGRNGQARQTVQGNVTGRRPAR